ncbi:hypothetical protein BAE44_0017327 [Dichanthelium oligosanthes]|uniref:BSD domain-containing protein n=1 Tax=Dichanthelium oligosanthes TaxID=888268 RepID=A0A1E5V928_9POAL|nr:hypothetical protein BAE44_0017327 [Dichanthelium oligosanthes]
MAWLARSIANSLLSPEEDESSATGLGSAATSPGSSSSPPRGVREDLSELTGALANRFQGLASFLAPAAAPGGGGGAPRGPVDPAEIAGRFRAGLARLPGRQAVADLAKIASSLLPPEGDAYVYKRQVLPQLHERGLLLEDILRAAASEAQEGGCRDSIDSTEVLGVSKGQDGSVTATSFSKIDYGIPQPTNQESLSTNAISDAGAVSSDNISSSVPVQLVPVLKDETVVSQSRMEESACNLSTEDSGREEQSMQMPEIALVDNSPPKDDKQKQPLDNISEQSRVDIQKTYHDEDDDDDDGDEWLEEETGGPGNTATIPIADDEDVSFSDLEDDDGST